MNNVLSTYLENALLSHLLRSTSYTSPNTLHFAMFTAAPDKSGGGTECTGGSYARAAVSNNTGNFPQCSAVIAAPVKSNGTAITFPKATASWGTVTHWAVFDAATAGNMLAYGSLATQRVVAIGDTPKIAIGVFTISLNNSASGGLSAYSKRKLLDLAFGKTAFTTPAAVYGGVGTALADESITEWTDSGAATRKALTFGAPADGITTTSADAIFDADAQANVTVTHFGVWDALTSGNLLAVGPLSGPVDVSTGDSMAISSGGMTFNLQ